MSAPRTAAGLWDLMKREGMEPEGPRPKERKRPDNEESRSQAALIDWWHHAHKSLGIAECLLFAVGNGGFRSPATGAIMKREGVKAGTSDLLFLVARGPNHGLCIEMKRPDGVVSPEQRAFLKAVGEQGYRARVCYSTKSAIDAITEYLE